jgi:hypothetical protein
LGLATAAFKHRAEAAAESLCRALPDLQNGRDGRGSKETSAGALGKAGNVRAVDSLNALFMNMQRSKKDDE